MELLIGILIAAVVAGAIIWLVSKLNLGLTVDSFGWAMIAGLLIGVLTNLVLSFVTGLGGVVGFIVHLVIAAGVIWGCGAVLKGLKVHGYVGALVAALAIAVINFLIGWLLVSML